MTTAPVVVPGFPVMMVDPRLVISGWRDCGVDERCGVRPAGHARASREEIIDALASRGVLWPLIDSGPSCRRCASPRKLPAGGNAAVCSSCCALAKVYANSLADLYPISYTAARWDLCAGIRTLKDTFDARSDSLLARDIGAILSAYLEHQLGGRRLGLSRGFGIVTTVPSSRPVIAAALRRAAEEGWWSPHIAVVATGRRGHRRQRQRPDALRMYVHGKWDVDRAAVNGLGVLVLDDIYTSGGSVHSLAYALRSAGAASVHAVVLARNVGTDGGVWVLPLLREHHDAGCRWMPAVGKYDVMGGRSSRQAGAVALSPRSGGSRGRARSAAREAAPRSFQPCRPR